MGKKQKFFMAVAVIVGVMSLLGCTHVRENSRTYSGDNYVTSSIAYPTGRTGSSNLLLEKSYPQVVRLGKTYDYTIKVTNLTDLHLTDVKVSEVMPKGFSLASSEPAVSSKAGDKVVWNLGNLAARDTVVIKVVGKAAAKQELPCCTEAEYVTPALCLDTQVIEPDIAVEVEVPQQVTACDLIPVKVTVRNTGDGVTQNVVVKSDLPAGVVGRGGEKVLSSTVGSLAKGESRQFTSQVQAEKTGAYRFTANAESMADEITAVAAAKSTKVVQPRLSVSVVKKSDMVYIGRPVEFSIQVRNIGDFVSQNTILQATLPANADLGAAPGGSRSGRIVQWNIGDLAVGASKDFSLEVIGRDAGSALVEASVKGVCADLASASASTSVKGIPALLLEVVDHDDPIEVGSQETYYIKVTNQGSATARNIKIDAELEDMEFVSGQGPTALASSAGNRVSFTPLAELAPKASRTWEIVVIGKKAGDIRFKAIMNSEDLNRPVEETEATRVY